MQISVIMSVYREHSDWLVASIESIRQQTYTDLEFIIVIDDPENQELISIVRSYALKDKRIKYFVNDENRGLVYSLNKALKHVRGEYIARMDADDISNLSRLEKQLHYLQENKLDMIGTNVRLFRKENDFFYTTDKLLTHKYLKKMLAYGAIGIVHPTFFGKAIVFKTLNGYSDVRYVEDMDFLARALCKGYKVGNMKEALLDCRYRNDSVTKTYAYRMYINSRWVTRVFRQCLKSGIYVLRQKENKYRQSVGQADNFNKKQLLMVEAREAWADGKYINFLLKIVQATYSSRSVFYSLKINIILKILKLFENRELGSLKR